MPIEILWDDGNALAIAKPAGIATQAPAGIPSVETCLREQLGTRTEYLAFPHRLDRPVSGVLLVALQKRAARLLSEQFAARRVKKVYLANVHGQVVLEETMWTDWLRKLPDRAKVVGCAADAPGAKQARTLAEIDTFQAERGITRLRLMPQTGRMHQLRFQTARRGHPILGDQVYQTQPEDDLAQTSSHGTSHPLDPKTDTEDLVSDTDRGQAIDLHAYQIEFFTPKSGVRTIVTASADRLDASITS